MDPNGKTHTPDQQMQPTPALSAAESDVKPDTKVFYCNGVGGDFMSRVSKGGKRLFIEEYPQTCSAADGGSLSGGPDRANPPRVSAKSTEERCEAKMAPKDTEIQSHIPHVYRNHQEGRTSFMNQSCRS
jgi:hypothetical protein